MQRQIQLLQQLVLDSQYTVDPTAVAEAILARGSARRAAGGVAFRNDPRSHDPREEPLRPVRSFRPTRHARSFRPCNVKLLDEGLIQAPRARP
jgi:hypothetical protein